MIFVFTLIAYTPLESPVVKATEVPDIKVSLDDLDHINHPHMQTPSVIEQIQRHSLPWADFYIPILEMHDFNSNPKTPYTMSPAQLSEEMAFLKSHGFHTVSLDHVYNAIHHNLPLPSRPIVLTFDDGYESNFIIAAPILKKYGFCATEFMVSSFVNKPGFLTEAQLKNMTRSHIWEIESHTVSHSDLTKLKKDELWNELSRSKDDLASIVQSPIHYFSYPYGAYNEPVLRDVERTGYLLAVRTNQGYAHPMTDGPFLLNRIAIHQGLSIADYAKLLSRSTAGN
jgi:peptidoglycan/xylan/chitin deacetylase (PgdA/CDA1 family)